MSANSEGKFVQWVYAAVTGGLTASFVGLAVFRFLLENGSGTAALPALVGLVFAIGFMVAGLFLSDRAEWLATALLFASGFTALWSVFMTLGVEDRWVSLLALAVAIGLAGGLGWLKFGRARSGRPHPGPSFAAPAAPTASPEDTADLAEASSR